MIEMTSSQRKMLAQIQKSKKKGIRWDTLLKLKAKPFHGKVAPSSQFGLKHIIKIVRLANQTHTIFDMRRCHVFYMQNFAITGSPLIVANAVREVTFKGILGFIIIPKAQGRAP